MKEYWSECFCSSESPAKALGTKRFRIMSFIGHCKTWQRLSTLFAANNVRFTRILIWFHLEGENVFFVILLRRTVTLPPQHSVTNLKVWAPGCCRISASAWSMSSLRIGLFRSASLNRSRRSITFLVDGSGWQWERETITLEMRFAPSTSPVAFRILVHGTSDKRSAKHRFTMCIQLCRKLLAAHRSPVCTKRRSHCSLPRCWWCVTKQWGETQNLLWKSGKPLVPD